MWHKLKHYNSSYSRKTAFEEPEQWTHAAEGRRGKHMTLKAAWQPVKTLLLLSVLLQAHLCTAQPGILPPMPPLGFFGGLLDGLGLGDNTPPAPPSPSVYREPYASPAIRPQTATSASSGKGYPHSFYSLPADIADTCFIDTCQRLLAKR